MAVRPEATAQVPAAPAYLQPVAVPTPKIGESAMLVAARERGGRLRANTIINSARRDWTAMRARLAGKQTKGR